jgi:hypothetical protein
VIRSDRSFQTVVPDRRRWHAKAIAGLDAVMAAGMAAASLGREEDQPMGPDSDQETEDSGGSWYDGVTDALASAASTASDYGSAAVDYGSAAVDAVAGGGDVAAAADAIAPGAVDAHEAEPSTWDNIKAMGSTVLKEGPEIAKFAAEHFGSKAVKEFAESVPAVGAIPAVINGIQDSDKSSDARRDAMLHEDDKDRVQMDRDKDAFYQGREDYDLMTAIPFVGTAAAVGEVGSGVYNWAKGREGGYEEGENQWKDRVEDYLDRVTNSNGSITGGASHTQVARTGDGAREALRKKYEAEAAAQGADK